MLSRIFSALFFLVFITQCCIVCSFFFSKSNTNTKTHDDPVVAIEPITVLTGVPSHLLEKYSTAKSTNRFVCDNNSKVINSNEINDEYCDCLDGTDEPGTNACGHVGSFYCLNKGFKSLTLPSSRVNDGICDCCDGSDENLGINVECHNTCQTMAIQEKEKLKGLQTMFNQGYAIRSQLIQTIKSKYEKDTKDLPEMNREIDSKTERLTQLESELNAEREIVRQHEMESEQNTIGFLVDLLGMNKMKDSVNDLSTVLKVFIDVTHISDDEIREVISSHLATPPVTANTPAAVVNTDEQQTVDNAVVTSEGEDSYEDHAHDDDHVPGHNTYENDMSAIIPSPTCALATVDEQTVRHVLAYLCQYLHPPENIESPADVEMQKLNMLFELVQTVILSLLEQYKYHYEAQLIFGYYHIHGNFQGVQSFITDLNIQDTQNLEQTCPNLFVSTKGRTQVELCNISQEIKASIDRHKSSANSRNDKISSYETDINALRSSVDAVKSRRQAAETAASELKLGDRQLAYIAMKNECPEVKDAHFTYKVCILGDIHQNDDQGDHGSVKLGDYYGTVKESGTGASYMNVLKFQNGQHCHAFGARSAELQVKCGVENKVLSAREPSTCAYLIEMESPAACTPRFAQENGLELPV